MADSKLTALTEETAPAGDDLVYMVVDPGGTAADRKATVNNLLRYEETFTDGDLTAGVITITHNRNFQYPGIFVINDNNNLVGGYDVDYTDADNLDLDLSGFGTIPNTWRVIII